MAWKIPGVGQPGHDELVAIASLLTDGRASRLYDALVVRRPVLLEVEAGVANLQYGDMFQIDAKPADGVSLAEAEKAITAEMDGFFAADVDPAKIKALAAKAEANRFRALQDAHELANALADGEARLGDPLAIVNAGDNLRKMTPESLRKAGAAALVPSARAVIGIVPPGEIK
jgi:predicted Zn-dependent peptidase